MDTLQLKNRLPVEEEVENWDDGDFMMEGGDDFGFRSPSATTAPSRRRDSNSSHMSLRSELESWAEEEENQVHIPGDDEKSTMEALSAAKDAGIPLPTGISASALMGGTIKRLGGRKIRKITQEDWDNDLEIPDSAQGFKIKAQDDTAFPEVLRQVSGGSVQASPTKLPGSTASLSDIMTRSPSRASSASRGAPLNLDQFKDNDEDDFFGDGLATVKVAKRPVMKPISLITPPTPQKAAEIPAEDDFEQGLELPSDGTLQLSQRRDIPKTPLPQFEDLDWGEGSLGTRFGGTRRDGRSNRSSSTSALSPSVASSVTAESEDETFDGLVLPTGPVNFNDRLQQRRKSKSPVRVPEEPSPPKTMTSTPAEADRPGFLDGLDIGDGDMFNSGKLTLHRNIKLKEAPSSSPARPKTAVSLTFTNKPSTSTRIPRLHERAHSTSLEPVSESGGPIPPRARPSKSLRSFRRHDSDNSIELRPKSRSFSRVGMRSPSPQRYRVAADTWERLSKPKNRRHFGDGHELDAFDDLPTSKENETRFMKQPTSGNGKATLRNKASDRMSTPTPTPTTPQGPRPMPHFARDTTASRIARETSLAHRSSVSISGPLAQTHAQRGTPLANRSNLNTPHLEHPQSLRAKKSKRPAQQKPHLISNLNADKESKMVNGMFYNPETFRWEGNENALNIFEAPCSTPTTATTPAPMNQEKATTTPRPALITNISATKGVQVVNGMVFDPQSMSWLKIGNPQAARSDTSDTFDKFDAFGDEDDVFKDIPDLDDNTNDAKSGQGRVSDVNDEWLVGEEFDVGPEFIRRQREEEERWRKKCDKWVGRGMRDREAWRWTIRELVSQFDDLPM
ncbi:putative cytokinesis regulator protein [Emericellopsis cladophorae]|uniref:Cytokinesis regulator protein n=1 Tax=Emericellopsis cladophorae TaxID=2686198 RepID=A0A9P9XYT4_9HYPO|nr:putative cytokinesis regulator protein [Emericellopsis cladophorae]KAI6779834.1 putative cytokinesis regulator protein [Emericellopsis cladophorae]